MIRRYETAHSVRWHLLETRHGGVQLVKLKQPNPREQLHTHSWGYVDVVLRGGYVELRRYHGLSVHVTVKRYSRRRSRDQHIITRLLDQPTWLVRFHGARVRRAIAHA